MGLVRGLAVLAALAPLAAPCAGCGGKAVDETGSGNDAAGGDGGADAGRDGAVNGAGGGPHGGTTASGGTSASGGSGGIPDAWFECTDTSQCVLTSAHCCDPCQYEIAADARAVRRDALGALKAVVCAAQDPVACPPVACGPPIQFVVPLCIEGKCTALDIRGDKLTSCSTDAECRLRQGAACCIPCSAEPGLLVAVNAQVDYDRAVCGSGSSCPECVGAPIPSDARAVCVSSHCFATFVTQ